MKKRDECRCICHTDAVALGWIEGPMHVVPCCEPDPKWNPFPGAQTELMGSERKTVRGEDGCMPGRGGKCVLCGTGDCLLRPE